MIEQLMLNYADTDNLYIRLGKLINYIREKYKFVEQIIADNN